MIERDLGAFGKRWWLDGWRAPEMQAAITRLVAGPGVAAQLGRYPPVLGAAVVSEHQRRPGRAAGRLVDQWQRRSAGFARVEVLRGSCSRQERQLGEVVEVPHVARAYAQLGEAGLVVRHERSNVREQLGKLGLLQRLQLVERAPLRALQPLEVMKRGSLADAALPTRIDQPPKDLPVTVALAATGGGGEK